MVRSERWQSELVTNEALPESAIRSRRRASTLANEEHVIDGRGGGAPDAVELPARGRAMQHEIDGGPEGADRSGELS